MNSELEAIMRRRRRKADGLPGSPSPRKKEPSTTSDMTSRRSSSQRQAAAASPPPLPPAPSSVSTTRRSKLTSMRKASPTPPVPEVVQSPPSSSSRREATTRRRALDQIRARRSYGSTTPSPSQEETSPEKQQHDESLVQNTNDSILTQEAVVHGITDVSSGLMANDSMDAVVVAAPTDESSSLQVVTSPLASPESSKSLESAKSASFSLSEQASKSPISSYETPEKSESYSSPEKSIKSYTSPEKSIKSYSPPEKSTPRSSPEPRAHSPRSSPDDAAQDLSSSVDDSPVRSSPRKQQQQQEVDSSSSSEEEVEEEQVRSSPSLLQPQELEPTISTSFAHFEADFGTSFPNASSESSNMFAEQVAEYEPPPVFEAFEPMPEPIDYTPLENVPSRPKPTVSLQQETILKQESYHCPPTTNPLNGNVIACRTNSRTGEIEIYEIQVDPAVVQVEYSPVFTAQVQDKFKSTYGSTAICISKVLSIAAGRHLSQGQARVRVAALVEFQALNATGKQVSRTVLLVWQWGYGTSRLVSLQSMLSPPNKASFTYDSQSLQMADGMVFLSGMVKGKGPCVFSVKPYVKDVWSANVMPGSGTISAMAVTNSRRDKYIAIAQTDGSLSVWTYDVATVNRTSIKTDPKSLFPLCRLYGASAIPKARQTVGDEDGYISEKQGYCTSLAWKSEPGGLLFLAAAFSHGMAVYHVSLPLLKEANGATKPLPESTATTQLSQSVLLPSFVAAQWACPMERVSVSWVSLGSHPCLSFLLKKESTIKAIMGVIKMPLYGEVSEEAKSTPTYPFTVLASSLLPTDDAAVVDLVSGSSWSSSTLYHKGGSIMELSPKLSSDDSFFRFFKSPTISAAPGLNSIGQVWLPDTTNDSDGILQIFTVKQCKREVTDLPSPVPNTERLDWTPPKQRYLLCKSFVGDNKGAQDPSPEAQKVAEYGEIETVTCGNYVELVCDINMPNLVPRRIVRCKDSSLCGVLLYRGIDHEDGCSEDAVSIALIDTNTGALVDVHDGRDIVFLPNSNAGEEQALVLSVNGSSIQMVRRVNSLEDSDDEKAKTWEESDASRILLDIEADDGYVEARRLHLHSSDKKLRLLVVGTKTTDDCSCLVMGKISNIDGDNKDTWKSVIPSMKNDATLWFEGKETVQSLLILPGYENNSHLLATATSSRLLLLSMELRIIAETPTPLSTASLVPLGSHSVAYCSRDFKLRYLCSLGGRFSSGILATLPLPRLGYEVYQLIAIRPDRFVYTNKSSVIRLVEQNDNAHAFYLPTAITRPALLLEPMVANALCESDSQGESTAVLRTVIEKFGRKVAPFPHGDDEGIGPFGSGLTPVVFEMLSAHGLKHPASWLVTGTCRFDRTSNSRILPPWIPVGSKSAAALNSDANLHIVANGDQYFSDFVKSPDENMASTLPRPSDPSAAVCHELARKAMEVGDVAGALKLLDVAGSSESDATILQLALSSQMDASSDVSELLNALSGPSKEKQATTRPEANQSTTNALAALAVDLQSRQVNGKVPQQSGEISKTSDDFRRQYMTQLAPSIQRSRRSQRIRHRLIGESALASATRGMEVDIASDNLWQNPCNESKHAWNEGPQKDKENLLLLDRMEEWLGRKRPAVLGKEGAEAALERGEKTLADILNRANDYDEGSFGDDSAIGSTLLKDGWIEGIGEARADEDNLSFYLRMSEGADEDSTWRTDGLADLTSFANKATLVGRGECFSLEPTSSSVDEGEPGKVKVLYDLVFESPTDSESPVGLLLEAPRGSSLDVGMLHADAHDARRRCSLEFWFRLPLAESVTNEIILARRSVASSDDTSSMNHAGNKEGLLWELVLLTSGELEFRSNGGTSLLSSSEANSEFEQNQSMGDFGDTSGSNDDGGIVSWERPEGGGGWNHVCLVLSSRKQEGPGDCMVKMFMKGIRVASTIAKLVLPGLDGDELKDASVLDEAMKSTVYLFGLNAVAGFRMTEMRLWSCERSEDDIKMMMYEYLRAAETKKKIKVRIRNRRGDEGTKASVGGLLSPPPSSTGLLSPPPLTGGGLLSPPRDSKGPKSSLMPPCTSPADESAVAASADDNNFAFDASFRAFAKTDDNEPTTEEQSVDESKSKSKSIEQRFLEEMTRPPPPPPPMPRPPRRSKTPPVAKKPGPESTRERMMQNERVNVPAPGYSRPQDIINLQDHAELRATLPSTSRLSKEVRSSAAAALVRGPPATRHFGGNRGGLSRATPSDRNLSKRYGVGAIAICGAEKTVVYDHDEEPKGKTYPIGASGAVISDEMDNGEYLCCFLAKDKRMVVFELLTRTVVVELQMTTKLNYWRYLPPQAHGHTLAFMLITPVGGFHWVPLDESPRPIQVWKRGPLLQGKKIVTYEEGGSNGFGGAEALSAVALLLVSTASTGTPLEAWILQVGGESQALCVSNNVLGAALFRPYHIEDEAFLPHLVTATGVESEIVLKVEPLSQNPATGELAVEDVSIGAIVDQSQVRRTLFTPPALAMGGWPEVICCTCQGFVVACVRRKGLVVAYDCQEELILVRQEHVENYIVDGALRPGTGGADVELMLLLADSENPRDGFVMSIDISKLP